MLKIGEVSLKNRIIAAHPFSQWPGLPKLTYGLD
jgi:hypothetical protein